MTNTRLLRKELAAAFPEVKFKLKTVSFEGFGYGKKVFIIGENWPVDRVGEARYIASRYDAIVEGLK